MDVAVHKTVEHLLLTLQEAHIAAKNAVSFGIWLAELVVGMDGNRSVTSTPFIYQALESKIMSALQASLRNPQKAGVLPSTWQAACNGNLQAVLQLAKPLVGYLPPSPTSQGYFVVEFENIKKMTLALLSAKGKGAPQWGQTAVEHYLSFKLTSYIVEQFELDHAGKFALKLFSCTKTTSGSTLRQIWIDNGQKLFPTTNAPKTNKILKDNPWFGACAYPGNPSEQVVYVNLTSVFSSKSAHGTSQAAGTSTSQQVKSQPTEKLSRTLSTKSSTPPNTLLQELVALVPKLWPRTDSADTYLQHHLALALLTDPEPSTSGAYPKWCLPGSTIGSLLREFWLDHPSHQPTRSESVKMQNAPFHGQSLKAYIQEKMGRHFSVEDSPLQPGNWMCVLNVKQMLKDAKSRAPAGNPTSTTQVQMALVGLKAPSSTNASSCTKNSSSINTNSSSQGRKTSTSSNASASASTKTGSNNSMNTSAHTTTTTTNASSKTSSSNTASRTPSGTGAFLDPSKPVANTKKKGVLPSAATATAAANATLAGPAAAAAQAKTAATMPPPPPIPPQPPLSAAVETSATVPPQGPVGVICVMVPAVPASVEWCQAEKLLDNPEQVVAIYCMLDKKGKPRLLMMSAAEESASGGQHVKCFVIDIPGATNQPAIDGLKAALGSATKGVKVVCDAAKWLGALKSTHDIRVDGHVVDLVAFHDYLSLLQLVDGASCGSVLESPSCQIIDMLLDEYASGVPGLQEWKLSVEELHWSEEINVHGKGGIMVIKPSIVLLPLYKFMLERYRSTLPYKLLGFQDPNATNLTPDSNTAVQTLKRFQKAFTSSSGGLAHSACTFADLFKIKFVINTEHQIEAGLFEALAELEKAVNQGDDMTEQQGASTSKEQSVDAPSTSGSTVLSQDGPAVTDGGFPDPDVQHMLSLLPPELANSIPREWTLSDSAVSIVELVADHARQLQVKFGSVPSESVGTVVSLPDVLQHLAQALKLDIQPSNDSARAVSGGSASTARGLNAKTTDPLAHLGKQLFWRPDNRLTIEQSLHRISAMKDVQGRVTGLTFRIGRHIPGVARILEDVLYAMCENFDAPGIRRADNTGASGLAPEYGFSMLLLGRPGCGKTTMLRDVTRVLADGCRRDVVVVDTSNEVAGDGVLPHPCIGRARRLMVAERHRQHAVMLEAVQNHMPQVLVIDELGRREEVSAAKEISQRGIMMVATAHGTDLHSLMKNGELNTLVGGMETVTLGDAMAERTNRGSKTRTERKAAPAFDVLVEVLGKRRYRVHPSTAASVDAILSGQPPPCHIRSYDQQGNMTLEFESSKQAFRQLRHLAQQQHHIPEEVLQQHLHAVDNCSKLLGRLQSQMMSALQKQLAEAASSYADESQPNGDGSDPVQASLALSDQASGCTASASLPPVLRYDGLIKYAATVEEAEKLCMELLACQPDVVGLDAEWVPERQKGVSHPVALLQLCYYSKGGLSAATTVPDSSSFVVLLLHIMYTGVPVSLAKLLADSRIHKVGVAVKRDAARIVKDHPYCQVQGTMDLATQAAAIPALRRNGTVPAGLAGLVEVLLGRSLPKLNSLRCSAWDRRPLSEEQQRYAVLDAYASLVVHLALQRHQQPGSSSSSLNNVASLASPAPQQHIDYDLDLSQLMKNTAGVSQPMKNISGMRQMQRPGTGRPASGPEQSACSVQ